jgi:hypothetical protein
MRYASIPKSILIFALKSFGIIVSFALYHHWIPGSPMGLDVLFALVMLANHMMAIIVPFIMMGAILGSELFSANTPLVRQCAVFAPLLILVCYYAWHGTLLRRTCEDDPATAILKEHRAGIRVALVTILFVETTFRGLEPVALFMAVIILSLLFFALPCPGSVAPKQGRQYGLSLVLFFVSIALSVAIVELGCRIGMKPPAPGRTLYEADSEYLFVNAYFA